MHTMIFMENIQIEKRFNVDESYVIKSQYTWTVVTGETDIKKEE